MFTNKNRIIESLKTEKATLESTLSAIDGHLASIEFTPEGIITEVNSLFLSAVGYTKQELIGQHHSQLCCQSYAHSDTYIPVIIEDA